MKANKYRIKPTPEQKEKLAIQFGCARFIYNDGLAKKIQFWESGAYTISRFELQAMLVWMKKDYDTQWLKQAHSQVLQSALLHLETAFKNFFTGRAKFPRFKNKYGKQSCQFPQGVKLEGNKLFIPKVGWVNAVIHRQATGKIKTVTLSKNAVGQYFASVLLDDGSTPPDKIQVITRHVGLDMGIHDFISVSDGTKINNPRFTSKQLINLRRKQQSLSRKKKGSQHYTKAKRIVAKAHLNVKNARNDFQHKLSFNLANNNHVVSIEDLNISGMMKNKRLSRHIVDLGWYDFTSKLHYKLDDRGHYLQKVGRFFPSSKRCSHCHEKVDTLPLTIRSWTCPSCQTKHDRDTNAAINIDAEGMNKIIADYGCTATACGGFCVSLADNGKRYPAKHEAPLVAQA